MPNARPKTVDAIAAQLDALKERTPLLVLLEPPEPLEPPDPPDAPVAAGVPVTVTTPAKDEYDQPLQIRH